MSLDGLGRAITFLRQHKQLVMISTSTVVVMAGQGLVGPVLPLFATEFGVGAATVGLTLSAFALARLILNVPIGILADRHGRRLLLVGGPLVTAVGMIGSGLSQNIEQLLAWRFLAGAGSAMYMTGAAIYLIDISTPENRARFIGTNQGALLLGVSIGPAVGGLIAQGFGLRAPFYVVGVAALVASVFAFLWLPETRPDTIETRPATGGGKAAGGGAPRPWLLMIRSRDFIAVSLLTMSLFFTRTGGQQTMVPLLSVSRLGMSPGTLGGVFTGMALMNMILITPASMAADRFGRKAVIIPSGAVVALGLLLFAGANGYALYLVAAVVLAAGTAIAGAAPAAYAADIAPEEARGLAMGLYRSSGDLGFVIGPPLLGLIADFSSFGWALAANALLVGMAALMFGVLARETVGRAAVTKPSAPALRPRDGGDG